MSFKLYSKNVESKSLTEYHFVFTGDKLPSVFTSVLNGKWNGRFSVDGCYSAKGGLKWEEIDMIQRRIENNLTQLTDCFNRSV